MQFNPTGSTAAQFCATASDKEHHLMTRIRNRAALIALPLALGTLAVGAASASANSYQWGDNGSGACNAWQSALTPSQAGVEIGTYCMQSVTGWITINGGATQDQAISCANNDSSSGLSYSTDGQAYVNDGPWYALATIYASDGDPGDDAVTAPVAWQTGNGGDADLSSESWDGMDYAGSNSSEEYGSAGAGVTNWGGNGGWQTAVACKNGEGDFTQPQGRRTGRSSQRFAFPTAQVAKASAPRARDRTIDSADKKKGRAFLAREYVLKKNVTRTDTRTCPAGLVRRGKLAYTVQEFPADNKFSWKNRSLVDVKMTAKGKNAGSVKMKLKRAKNPTVVQFQMRCGKR